MEDNMIIELYFSRDERAIQETSEKYGSYLLKIANNILNQNESSEECVNDTYLRTWNTIPPTKPGKLSAFLARITRNLAIDHFRKATSDKHGLLYVPAVAEEYLDVLDNATMVYQ